MQSPEDEGITISFFSNGYVRSALASQPPQHQRTTSGSLDAAEARRQRRLTRLRSMDMNADFAVPEPVAEVASFEVPSLADDAADLCSSPLKRGVSFASELENVRSIPPRDHTKRSKKKKKSKEQPEKREAEKEESEKEKAAPTMGEQGSSGTVKTASRSDKFHKRSKSTAMPVTPRAPEIPLAPLTGPSPPAPIRAVSVPLTLPSPSSMPSAVRALFQVGENEATDSLAPAPSHELTSPIAIRPSLLRLKTDSSNRSSGSSVSSLTTTPQLASLQGSPSRVVREGFLLGETALPPAVHSSAAGGLSMLRLDTRSTSNDTPSTLPSAVFAHQRDESATSLASSSSLASPTSSSLFGFDPSSSDATPSPFTNCPSPPFQSRAGVQSALQRRSKAAAASPGPLEVGQSWSSPTSPEARLAPSSGSLLQHLHAASPSAPPPPTSARPSHARVLSPTTSPSPPSRALSDPPPLPQLSSSVYAAQLAFASAQAAHLHHLDLAREQAQSESERLTPAQRRVLESALDSASLNRRHSTRLASPRATLTAEAAAQMPSLFRARILLTPDHTPTPPPLPPPQPAGPSFEHESDASLQRAREERLRSATAQVNVAQYGWEGVVAFSARHVRVKPSESILLPPCATPRSPPSLPSTFAASPLVTASSASASSAAANAAAASFSPSRGVALAPPSHGLASITPLSPPAAHAPSMHVKSFSFGGSGSVLRTSSDLAALAASHTGVGPPSGRRVEATRMSAPGRSASRMAVSDLTAALYKR